jgi:rfaE bifunctional protein nucleotidyltransferase chain/domain
MVFTNGVFDLLHEGHLHLLRESSKLGDVLYVAINTDESVRRLKGPHRPIMPVDIRAKQLMETGLVYKVLYFEDDTPYSVIKLLLPDIITKGGDYKPEEVVGHDISKVVIIPRLGNYSTTKKIADANYNYH